MNFVFLFGSWVLWFDANLHSELCRKGRRMGIWRAIADLSEAMREFGGGDLCVFRGGAEGGGGGEWGAEVFCGEGWGGEEEIAAFGTIF